MTMGMMRKMSIWTLDHWGYPLSYILFMNAMFWNVRGANRRGFANEVKTFKRLFNISLIAIFEPRMGGKKLKL